MFDLAEMRCRYPDTAEIGDLKGFEACELTVVSAAFDVDLVNYH